MSREQQTALLDELGAALSALSDEELESCTRPVPEETSENVYRFLLVVNKLVLEEAESRESTVQAMEADLNGGHLVTVTRDDGGYVAECWPGRWCWNGPLRGTVEDAAEDGRRHHPAHEPRVHD